jgi:hypothetical protein
MDENKSKDGEFFVGTNFCSDIPICKAVDDKLNRSHFADTIAESLLSNNSLDNLVVLLNGRWGSGKTSLINLIKESIISVDHNQAINLITPVIIDYSPWNCLSQDAIIGQFLNTLSNGFRGEKIKQFLRTIKKSLLSKEVLGLLDFIPLPSPITSSIKIVANTFKAYSDSITGNKNDLEVKKEQVEKALSKSKFRFLVFVDDLDRLNDSEIRLVMQLIKSVCCFPNITYILSFDKQIVASALCNEQSGEKVGGENYLEKIVQVEFDLPPVRANDIMDITLSDVEQLLGERTNQIDKRRFETFLTYGLFSKFETIRQEKRFINLLSFSLGSFDSEIDYIDLIVITYLRSIDQRIIGILSNYRPWLFGRSYNSYQQDFSNNEKQFYKELDSTNFKGTDKYLLGTLFPYMFSCCPDKIGNDYLTGKLCNQKRFNYYLYSTLDNDDISIESVKAILKSKDATIILEFIDSLKEEQGRMLLIVLVSYAQTLKEKCDFSFLINFLFCNLSKIKFSSQFMLVDKEYYLAEICTISLKTIGVDDTLEIIDNSIDNSGDISTIVDFGIRLENIKTKNGVIDFSSIDDQKRKGLISKIAEKGFELFKENLDSLSRRIPSAILFLIRNKKLEMQQYISKRDLKWQLLFVSKCIFIGRVDSSNKGSYNSYSYSIDDMKSVIDISKFQKDEVIQEPLDDKTKQNIIVLFMEIDGFAHSDLNNDYFTVEDIQKYCLENKIKFVPSDSYEKSEMK